MIFCNKMNNNNKISPDDFEILIRRRDKNDFASYCPQLLYMIKGRTQIEVKSMMERFIENYINGQNTTLNAEISENVSIEPYYKLALEAVDNIEEPQFTAKFSLENEFDDDIINFNENSEENVNFGDIEFNISDFN